MSESLLLQAPADARCLILLFHGVGATAQGLAPLGTRLAGHFADAAVVSVSAPDAFDPGAGRQWFSVRGVTEENRPERVAATLPRFLDTVRKWQAETGVGAAGTTLIGFSQGAILSLAASLHESSVAGRIVSLSGRWDVLPRRVPAGLRFHFLHGSADPVIPAFHAEQATARLQSLNVPATLDVVPGLGHGVSPQTEALLLQHLGAA